MSRNKNDGRKVEQRKDRQVSRVWQNKLRAVSQAQDLGYVFLFNRFWNCPTLVLYQLYTGYLHRNRNLAVSTNEREELS